MLPARPDISPVISFCNDVFIVLCSKLEEFHHRVVTILRLPGGQRLNIENTSDLDKLRADEPKRVCQQELTYIWEPNAGCLAEVFTGQTQEFFKTKRCGSHQLRTIENKEPLRRNVIFAVFSRHSSGTREAVACCSSFSDGSGRFLL